MFNIIVNHSHLRQVADSINAFCDVHETEMNSVVPRVDATIRTAWTGADATAFRQQWSQVNAQGSVSRYFLDSLRDYAARLKACADAYENAQADAVNSAGRLIRR